MSKHATVTHLPDTDVIEAGRKVLTHEGEALLAAANALGASFAQAVDLIAGIKGRVIVSGMGKSGHIGAKIAATLASTGTPAFFVHPGEASHGDLGMITNEDAVIALSHSGESKELSDLIAYCSRFEVPLIAMTGKAGSTLGKAATVVLDNGVKEEACPLNLAPTTSTTTTLAVADALAVALMGKRGFKPEDFARYHPGGKLGSKLARVDSLMAKGSDLPLVKTTDSMQQALLEMSAKTLGLVGVCDESGTLVGLVTDGDLRRHMAPDLLARTAADIMSPTPMTIAPDMLASAAVALMQNNPKGRRITALFVCGDDGKPQGVLHIHHCLQAGVI